MQVGDLADPATYATADRHRVWAGRRPVTRERSSVAGEFWSVTGCEQADAILRDTERYRSGAGNSLLSFTRADPAAGRMLVMTDPPRHGELRRELAATFSPRGVRRLEPVVRAIVDEALDDALDARRVDWVRDVAARIPVAVTAEVLGVPTATRGWLAERTAAALGADDAPGGDGDAAATRAQANGDLLRAHAELIAARRLRPREDVATVLATGRFGGERLTDEEAILNCHNILLGGNETARHAIAAGTLGLVDAPREWARLRAGCPLDAAVEEILRWTSPAMHVARSVARPTTLDGEELPARGRVVVWLAAANRDPAVHRCPHDLTLDRDPRHLAFGAGPHHCLGAAVARLELRVFLERLAARVARVERAGEAVHLASNFIGGLVSMPVEVHPA